MTDTSRPARATAPGWWRWVVLAVAVAGIATVVWVGSTRPGAVRHGNPAYEVMLALTVLGSLAAAWHVRRPLPRRATWRRILGILVVLVGVGWVVVTAWLRPLGAVQPALRAMHSDATVSVVESATRITMTPTGHASPTGVFFQPGAKVDPRAYAAVLRPLAEAGHPVVIAKPPLGIAFLDIGAFDATRKDHADITRWVVGGHSLGGVVAAREADDADQDTRAPAAGLLLYASYPATDISGSLTTLAESISGSRDGLSTPDKIEASHALLPPDTHYTVVDGAVHAFFGDYGHQPGDGTPTISHDQARDQISRASLAFVDRVSATSPTHR